MTRIIVEKDGIVTDVPENEAVNYLRKGYVKTGTLPDALPEKDQKSTPEQAAVMGAALKVAEAENELTKAETRMTLPAIPPWWMFKRWLLRRRKPVKAVHNGPAQSNSWR